MNVSPSEGASSLATPARGVLKGISLIILGFLLGLAFFAWILGSYQDYVGDEPAIVGLIWFVGIFGVFLWRGILAIHRRHRRRVSRWTLVALPALMIAVIVWIASSL